MDHLEKELHAAIATWDRRGWPRPQVMVVSGSGLATELGRSIVESSPWSDLLPFEPWGIEGHPLEIDLIEPCDGRVVLYSRGRLHAYQGFTAAQTVFQVRLAALLGAGVVILTNSSGGLCEDHHPGDLVLIRDQLNLSGLNPLAGSFPNAWGPQFPDMAAAYEPALQELFRASARELGIELKEGVYAGMFGPSYETPAEVRMLRGMGVDLVGMSMVLEVVAGHHMGVRCAGLSVVSNPAAGIGGEEVLDHADVLVQGREAARHVARLLGHVLTHPDLMG